MTKGGVSKSLSANHICFITDFVQRREMRKLNFLKLQGNMKKALLTYLITPLSIIKITSRFVCFKMHGQSLDLESAASRHKL